MKIDTAKNLHSSIHARGDSDDLAVFAYIAFQDLFEWELTTRWRKLEDAAYSSIVAAPAAEKYKPFQKFFEDAEALLADTIREYFKRLLDIAIGRSQHLGNVSPLDWTKSHILKEVCEFLGMGEKVDENFEWTSEPLDNSRVLSSAKRLTEIAGLEGESPSKFLLPRWTTVPHPAWALVSVEGRLACDAKFEAERMPLGETVQWVKQTEFLLGRKIALQIKKDHLDSCIDAGAPGKSVNLILDVAMQPATVEHGNVTAEPDQPVSENVPGDLGEWAERYLPELQSFASRVRTGDTLDVLRIPFRSLFTEVIDRLPLWQQERLFEDARGRRLSVPDLMAALAEVKHMAASTLSDHRKKYRRKSGTSRTPRSAVTKYEVPGSDAHAPNHS